MQQMLLPILLHLDLFKNQYQTIRKESAIRKLHLLPPYKHVQEEKKKNLPKNIKVTETCAEVPLKDLLIKTFHRHMEEKCFKKMTYQLQNKNGGKKLKLLYVTASLDMKYFQLTLNFDWPLATSYPDL